jgi:hypothetical protein
MHGQRLSARARRAAVVIAAAITAATGAFPAFAASGPVGYPRPLVVSVPADPAPLKAGTTGMIPIRVVNPGTTPETVRITGRAADFGDNGRVTITGRDPLWQSRITLPASPITISPQRYRDIELTVHVPAHIVPDLYFIGFLVTPSRKPGGNLTYTNQVGSYVTIDVPGPRSRALSANLELPGFAFATNARGALHVHNVGKAAVVYWGENDTTAAPGSSAPRQARFDRSLLPIGRSRKIEVTAKPAFPIAIITVRIHLFYPGRTLASSKEIVLTKHVLVVQPAAAFVLGAILLAGSVWLARRRRRRGHRRRAADRAPTKPSARSHRGPRPRVARRRLPVRNNVSTRVDRALAQVRAQRTADGRESMRSASRIR